MNQSIFLEVEKKRAVLVGINNYLDSSVRSLKYSVADVQSIYDILVDSERGRFKEEDVRLMVDDSDEIHKPNRSNLMSAIKSLTETASEKDVVILFFSGHGIEQDGKNYLLPLDSRINVLNETAVPIEWIKNLMVASDARVKILILDACHAGAIIGKSESGRMTKEFSEVIFSPAEGFAVLSSCKINEVSYEWPEKAHGVFTYYLKEGLLGDADFDSDGSITVSELNRYVSERVKGWAFSHSVQQNPMLRYDVSGDIVLSLVPRPIKKPRRVSLRGKNPKEYIGMISLRPAGAISVGELCAWLLSYYKPSQINRKEENYIFPDGYLTLQLHSNDVLRIHFKYKSGNWNKIDQIIEQLEKEFEWSGLRYNVKAKFDEEKLTSLCMKSKMRIEEWKPQEVFEMDVKATGWGRGGEPADVHFENIESDGALISITQRYIGKYLLENEFYAKLNPENIIVFLKTCLVDLTSDECQKYDKLLGESI